MAANPEFGELGMLNQNDEINPEVPYSEKLAKKRTGSSVWLRKLEKAGYAKKVPMHGVEGYQMTDAGRKKLIEYRNSMKADSLDNPFSTQARLDGGLFERKDAEAEHIPGQNAGNRVTMALASLKAKPLTKDEFRAKHPTAIQAEMLKVLDQLVRAGKVVLSGGKYALA